MNNPSCGALHSPLPSLAIDCQANQKCKEENQRKKSNNQHFRMVVLNFAHHAKLREVAKEFLTPCEISHGMRNFLCTDSVRFLSSDILCNFLVSPCNQLRYFILYFFMYLLGSLYIRRKTNVMLWMFFKNTCKFPIVRNIQSFCFALPSHFCFHFSF